MLLNKNLININKELWILQKEILDTNIKYTLQIFVLRSIKHFYNYYTSEIKENEIKPLINNKLNSPIKNIQNEAVIIFDYIHSI